MTKMTYAIAIDNAINGNLNEETIEKLQALKAQIEKRNTKERKPTKTQRENEGIKGDIVNLLNEGEPMQCKAVAEAIGVSGQKASALLNQLVDAGVLVKYAEKRVTYFKVAEVA